MKVYVVIETNCLDCGGDTSVLGVFQDRARAISRMQMRDLTPGIGLCHQVLVAGPIDMEAQVEEDAVELCDFEKETT